MSKCLNCGRELKDSAKFCPACGSPVPTGKEPVEEKTAEKCTASASSDGEAAEETAEELSFPYEGIYDNDVNRAAVEEYMYILQNDYDINGDGAATPYFALMDVNGDGVYEMFVNVWTTPTANEAGYFFWYDDESGEAVKESDVLWRKVYYSPQTSEMLVIYERMGATAEYYTFTGSSLEAEEDKGGFLEEDAYTYYTTETLDGYIGYESSEEEWALEETIIEEMDEFIAGAEEAEFVRLAEEEFTDYFGLGTEEYSLDGFSDYAAVIMSGYSWCHQYDDYISLRTDIYSGRYVEKAAVDSSYTTDCSYLIESNVILHIAPDATVTYMYGNREITETDAYSYFIGIDGDDSFLDRFWVQYDEDGLVTSLTFMYRP